MKIKKNTVMSFGAGLLVAFTFLGFIYYFVLRDKNDDLIQGTLNESVQSSSAGLLDALNSSDTKEVESISQKDDFTVFEIMDVEGVNIRMISVYELLEEGAQFDNLPLDETYVINEIFDRIPAYDKAFVSSDGTIYLLISMVDLSLRNIYKVNLRNILEDEDLKETTERANSSTSSQLVLNLEISYKLVNPRSTLAIEDGDQPKIVLMEAMTKNMPGSKCSFYNYIIDNGTKVVVGEQEESLLGGSLYKKFPFYFSKPGKYMTEMKCDDNSEIVEYEVLEAPGSLCDKYDFGIDKYSHTFSEVKAEIVGEWKGCVRGFGNKPYRVRIVFNDTTYSSENIEIIENPGTLRSLPGMYYGTDGESLLKTYELENQLDNLDVEGQIMLYFDNSKTTRKAKIESVRFSENFGTLYFELEGLEFKLERQ